MPRRDWYGGTVWELVKTDEYAVPCFATWCCVWAHSAFLARGQPSCFVGTLYSKGGRKEHFLHSENGTDLYWFRRKVSSAGSISRHHFNLTINEAGLRVPLTAIWTWAICTQQLHCFSEQLNLFSSSLRKGFPLIPFEVYLVFLRYFF